MPISRTCLHLFSAVVTFVHLPPQGTTLFYQPGLLSGGPVEHDCNTQRSIGYYLEALLMLAPFMKSPLKATLRGVTNDPCDPTVPDAQEFRLCVLSHSELLETCSSIKPPCTSMYCMCVYPVERGLHTS